MSLSQVEIMSYFMHFGWTPFETTHQYRHSTPDSYTHRHPTHPSRWFWQTITKSKSTGKSPSSSNAWPHTAFCKVHSFPTVWRWHSLSKLGWLLIPSELRVSSGFTRRFKNHYIVTTGGRADCQTEVIGNDSIFQWLVGGSELGTHRLHRPHESL